MVVLPPDAPPERGRDLYRLGAWPARRALPVIHQHALECPLTLRIVIDSTSPEAPYEQLRAQIAERARSGALPAGYRLPTVRGLAGELGLAANTVAKAYRVLETDGVVETRGRGGTVIAADGGRTEREAANAAEEYVRRVHRLGLDRNAALVVAHEAVRAVYGED